jgi:hypothetical protein
MLPGVTTAVEHADAFFRCKLAAVGLAGRGPINVEIFCWQPAKSYVVVQLALLVATTHTQPGRAQRASTSEAG